MTMAAASSFARRRMALALAMITVFLLTSPLFVAAGEDVVARIGLRSNSRLVVLTIFAALWIVILRALRASIRRGALSFLAAFALAVGYVFTVGRSSVVLSDLVRVMLILLFFLPFGVAAVWWAGRRAEAKAPE